MGDAGGGLRDRVARAIVEEAAPALEMDGAAVEVLDVAEGVARVRLTGGCGSCPGSAYAVVMALEEVVRRRVPEVRYLEIAP